MNESNNKQHQRRVRYRGTHPRRFDEKYKELDPSRHPETILKVIASGKTPAGTHRPVCIREVLDILVPEPGDVVVDATLGFGGHALALWDRIQPGGRLLGLDVDPIELAKTEERLRARIGSKENFEVIRSNYAGLPQLLARRSISGADIILADLGCSSMQLDNPERGFSWKHNGPLDLRMNPTRGLPAAKWLDRLETIEFERILRDYADEPAAAGLAIHILSHHKKRPIESTGQLASVLAEFWRSRGIREHHESIVRNQQRVFQGLRIAVNDEFKALETFLRFLPGCLRSGGRVAILSFHSGEDRRVKRAFRQGLEAGVYQQASEDVIRPSAAEVHQNPRASSARLRWAIRA